MTILFQLFRDNLNSLLFWMFGGDCCGPTLENYVCGI